LEDKREELMRMRFQLTTGELTDHNRLKSIRKLIARLNTVLAERAAVGAEDME
jgi:large subunit ribosomal protein L29